MRNIFARLKAIFERSFKFSDYEERKKFKITASEDQKAIVEQSGSDLGAIN